MKKATSLVIKSKSGPSLSIKRNAPSNMTLSSKKTTLVSSSFQGQKKTWFSSSLFVGSSMFKQNTAFSFNSKRFFAEQKEQEDDKIAKQGTESHDNLLDSYASTAMNTNRYSYFALKADVEGRPYLAGLFREVSIGKREQAFGHLEFLEEAGTDPVVEMPIGESMSNLQASIAAEEQALFPFFLQFFNNQLIFILLFFLLFFSFLFNSFF